MKDKGYQLIQGEKKNFPDNSQLPEACFLGRHVKRTFSWFTSLAGSDSQQILKRKVKIHF